MNWLLLILIPTVATAAPRLLARAPTIQKIEGSQASVAVNIKGKPTLLSVDTGSGYTILIPQFVAQMKIRTGKKMEETDGYGDPVTGYELSALEMSIGSWKQKYSNFVTEDMPSFSLEEPGILSPQHLKQVGLFVLNFPGHEMMFYDRAPSDLLKWASAQFSGFVFESLELFTSLGPQDKEGGVTYTKASLNKLAAAPMLIDTGARIGFFSDEYLTETPIDSATSGRSAGGKTVPSGILRNQILHLGAHDIAMAETSVHPKATLKGLAGVIGMDVLKDLILIVDYPRRRMLLGFPTSTPAPK